MADLVDLFAKIGLSSERTEDIGGNKKIAEPLRDLLVALELKEAIPWAPKGSLLYELSSSSGRVTPDDRLYIARAILKGDLDGKEKVGAALKWMASRDQKAPVDKAGFDAACGVGINPNEDDIKARINALFETHRVEIAEQRYRFAMSLVRIAKADDVLRWAHPLAVREAVEKQLEAVCGPKDERDTQPAKKPKEKAPPKKQDSEENVAAQVVTGLDFIFHGDLSKLHKPGENPQIKPELMQEHLARTKGEVRTRFPPEPNGFLHIGHAKAINVNFGYAQAHNGKCVLRYDDTNPEAEEAVYFESILETVRWLGFEPWKITYSSDHFERLYQLAVEMIKKGKAYVCHCTGEEIKADRGGEERGPRRECRHRDRPITENLAEFDKMKRGPYGPNEAVLRMKQDMQHPSPQFWDLVAYRVLTSVPHHRTGWDWRIYPTYDYTHCLCDSFEDITHSMCTTEFTMSRESYYWLCDVLEVYKPVQWEYGRLNITNTVLSKRKLAKLVEEKIVDGWDDPRLYTLPALRRRGFPPEAINNFVRDVGVSTSVSTIEVSKLENTVRNVLDARAPRLMAVLDPVQVTITNLEKDHLEWVALPNNPRDPAAGRREVPFTNTLYMERDDLRVEALDEATKKTFFRLAPGQPVGLAGLMKANLIFEKVLSQEGDKVTAIACRLDRSGELKKPKATVHWVPVYNGSAMPPNNKEALPGMYQSPIAAKVNMYKPLFKHANPQDKALGGFLNDVSETSLEVKNAVIEPGLRLHHLHGVNVNQGYQFQRVGYFCVDKATVSVAPTSVAQPTLPAVTEWVMNLTVTLREDSTKSA